MSNTWLLLKSTLLFARAHHVRIECMVHPEKVQDIRCSRWLGLSLAVIGVQGMGCYVVALGKAAQDYTDRVSLRIGARCLRHEPSRRRNAPLPLSQE